jgi:hypothetical protein
VLIWTLSDKVKSSMKIRRAILPVKAPIDKALDDLGGERLAGSGFESEKPEQEFTSQAPEAAPELKPAPLPGQ